MPSSPATDAPAMPEECQEDRQGAAVKRKRNLPGTPDPEAEVIALSPKTLMATNRFLCEVCGKGFQRDQNLQLHRRGHNLPWKLKQRDGQEVKRRVYVCPEPSCIHHDPSRALGDLTGIKKHFYRKHGEKNWKCEKCSKRYAVHSDWKAHLKVCGMREYRCDCGTLFSRKDNFVTHRAFCDALAQENAKAAAHWLAESHLSSDTGGNVIKSPPARDLSNISEVSPLPFQEHAASERLNSEIVEALGKDVWEASSTVTECKGPKGLQCGLSVTLSNPMMGSGLSLSLGTGLGPGPPCPLKSISSLSEPLDSALSFMMNKLVDTHSDGPDKILSPSPLASAGMHTNLLAAASSNLDFRQFEKLGHGRISDTCLSMAVGSMTDARLVSQFAASTYSDNGLFTPKHQQENTGVAQLPATTLLQKAAIMGATKSNPFLFRSLKGLCSISSQEPREHSLGVGTTTLLSSWQSQSMQPGAEGLHLNCGPRYGQEGRQYSRDELCVSRIESMSNGSSSSFSCRKGPFLFDGNKDHEIVVPSEFPNGSFRLPGMNITTCTELEASQIGETNRLTLDFLGVGAPGSFQEGSSSILGADARSGQFSHEGGT